MNFSLVLRISPKYLSEENGKKKKVVGFFVGSPDFQKI